MSFFFGDFFKQDPDKSFIVNYAPLFATLSVFEKKLIMEKSQVVGYRNGDVIYRQGDPPDAFYCVITGRVDICNVTADGRQTLEHLTCGNFFGIISLLTGEHHSVSAQAAGDAKILKITREEFDALLAKVPHLTIDLSKSLSRRLKKNDVHEKRIFESSIFCVFGAVRGLTGALVAKDFAGSLKRETGKNVSVINVLESSGSTEQALSLAQRHLFSDHDVKEAFLKNAEAGVETLDLIYEDTGRDACLANFNFLLASMTNDFHYIVVYLPSWAGKCAFQILGQSDTIYVLTDGEEGDLRQIRETMSRLSGEANYPVEQIKVMIAEGQQGFCPSAATICEALSCDSVYAALPAPSEDISSEYGRAIRRIAREAGNVRVGLALSGGAAFGLAHIGVIKVLEEEGIAIDAVAGTSMGALIGALWASGLDSDALAKAASEFSARKRAFRLLVEPGLPRMSIFKGARIRRFLERHIGNKTFRQTRFPFRVVACNLTKRQAIGYDSGSLVDAVMASIAIPGVFAPAKSNGDVIVDGGIINPVPIGILVRMGIKRIIAVNVLPSPENISQSIELWSRRAAQERAGAASRGILARTAHGAGVRLRRMFFPNIVDIIVNSMQTMEYVIAESECQKADVVIRPVAPGLSWFEFFRVEELIEMGVKETRLCLEGLKAA